MQFDTNQKSFPSDFHKEVWNIGCDIVPLEISLADVTDEDILIFYNNLWRFK